MKLYGIPNCSTVKKARLWLDEHGQTYEFHDFKKQGVTREMLESWIAQVSWEHLVNKNGTTWRNLDLVTQFAVVDAHSAIALMLSKPSVIKRPILDKDGRILLGFNPELYENLFK